jgi:hypothetical protein
VGEDDTYTLVDVELICMKCLSKEIVEPLLAAVAAYREETLTNAQTASFYEAYSKLATLFGGVTADTIRNCSSPQTRRTLATNRYRAVSITTFIATFSVLTFVADAMSTAIQKDIASANILAATLRTGLTPPGGTGSIDQRYAEEDPCELTAQPPMEKTPRTLAIGDVQQLQEFSTLIRDLRSQAIKLNWFVLRWECDPFDPLLGCAALGRNGKPQDDTHLNRQLQLNPTIQNYTAEVLCKIKTYQLVRTFSSNVQMEVSGSGPTHCGAMRGCAGRGTWTCPICQ